MRSKQQIPRQKHSKRLNPRRLGKYRKYSEDTLKKAYDAVKKDGLSVRGAAKKFGVPNSTLMDRVAGHIDHDHLKNKETLFNKEEEIALLRYIEALSQFGYSHSLIKLREIGGQLANALGKKPNGKPLSNCWVCGFTSRWKSRFNSIQQISTKSNQHKNETIERLKQYFESLHRTLENTKLSSAKSKKDKNIAARWLEARLEQIIVHNAVPFTIYPRKEPRTSNHPKTDQADSSDNQMDSSDNQSDSTEDSNTDSSSEESDIHPSSSSSRKKCLSLKQSIQKHGELFSSDDSDTIDSEYDESDVCCVCEKFSPPHLESRPYLKLVTWAYCDKCSHSVHLSFCHEKTTIRKADTFLCPHCI